ncbi:MAG: OmpH family outer membrane protein [Flavobacteriales bacterium]|nr:OmpH family outer membrane protein [Flavobacteriales bacterium]
MLSKISLGISLVLAVLVGVLFMKSGNNSEASVNAADDSAEHVKMSLPDGGVRIAYVVEDSILANYQYVLDEAPKLEDRSQAAARRYNQMLEQYQMEAVKWQEYLSSPSAKESDKDVAMQDMGERERKIQQMEFEIEKLQVDFNTEVFHRVTDYLNRYSEENGIQLVLNKNMQTASILYSNEVMDITSAVVSGLNAEYALENPTLED